MKRVMIKISYDGTNYNGWQSGGIGTCIEDVINNHLKEITGEDIKIIGTSRTDSGVHARSNIAVFDTNSSIDPNVFYKALNAILPEDIRILESKEVNLDFHPRRCNTKKIYTYKVLNQKVQDPLYRLYTYFVYHEIDLDKMKKAAELLVGEHDFAGFINPKSNIIQISKQKAEDNIEDENPKHTTIRTIYSIDITKDNNNIITFKFCGNGFLYHQIRIMVGSLLRVGMNMWEVEKIKEILDGRDRKDAGPTAPACGLCLEEIIIE